MGFDGCYAWLAQEFAWIWDRSEVQTGLVGEALWQELFVVQMASLEFSEMCSGETQQDVSMQEHLLKRRKHCCTS